MQTIDIPPLMGIQEAAHHLCALAPAEMEFNGFKLTALRGARPESVVESYYALLAGAERAQEQKRQEDRRDAARYRALRNVHSDPERLDARADQLLTIERRLG